jgi:hypothetical protein
VIIGNTIVRSQTSGVSLRCQNDVVQDNTITGGQKGIDFSSESATGGTTYVLGNIVRAQQPVVRQQQLDPVPGERSRAHVLGLRRLVRRRCRGGPGHHVRARRELPGDRLQDAAHVAVLRRRPDIGSR